MIKLTNIYLIGLVTASLLVGCGGGSNNDSETNEANEGTEHVENDEPREIEENGGNGAGNPDPQTPPTTTSTFSANVMPVLIQNCQNCHGSNGRFTITTASGTYANISDLAASVSVAGQYLLDKGSNSVDHGGGAVIPTSSAQYATIKSWVDAGADFN